MSKSQYKKYEGLILGTVWVDEFTTDEIAEWEAKLQEYEAFNRRIELTAERNNDGIEAEKKGDINGAIRLYEENVRDKVVATHSYDRLAIIYRRLKRYEDEIRVIKTALEVFGQENERRFKQAIETCRDQETLEAIKLARETCGTVRRPDGQVVYNPYPVMKWISRLSKSESLLQKSI